MTSDEFVKHIEALGIPGYGAEEIAFMFETVELVQPEFIYDWGTNRGSSARIFAEAAPEAWVDTIELPVELAPFTREHPRWRRGEFILDIARVEGHVGDGVTTALTIHAGRQGRALFFIDGDHEFHNVYREVGMIDMLAPRDTLLCHDTTADPGRAIEQFNVDWHRYDVTVCWSAAGMMRLTPR